MYTLKKFNVCTNCLDDPYYDTDSLMCVCRGRPRVDLEFLVCDCCGSPEPYPADTQFNREQKIEHGLINKEYLKDVPEPEDEIYRRTSVREMTQEELIELAKIRLSHDMTYGGHEIKKIEYEDFQDFGDDDISVSFIIEPKGYAKSAFYFGLEMFYPDEIKYLQSIGISIV